MIPDWFSLPSFFLGMVTICVLAGLWYLWEDLIAPRWKERRKENQANLEIARRALAPDEDATPPPSSIPHPPEPSLLGDDPYATKEPSELATADMPATQAHPAPSTGLIDFRKAPPSLPIPMPYQGPERRLRSDNPYPELRRRADDRERAEDAEAAQPPTEVKPLGHMTRAEARRLREADQSPEPSENPE